jgi:hypothetical protein
MGQHRTSSTREGPSAVTSNRRTHIGASVAYATLVLIAGGLVLSSADMLPDLELHDPSLTTVAKDTGVPAPDSIVTKTSRPRRSDTPPAPAAPLMSPPASVCVFGDGNCIASAVLLPDILFGLPLDPDGAGPTTKTVSGVPADGPTDARPGDAATAAAPAPSAEPPTPTDTPAAVPADPGTGVASPPAPTPSAEPTTDPTAGPTGEPTPTVDPSPVDPTPSVGAGTSTSPDAPPAGPDASTEQQPQLQDQAAQ